MIRIKNEEQKKNPIVHRDKSIEEKNKWEVHQKQSDILLGFLTFS